MQLNELIDSAIVIAGSQRKLAALIDVQPANLIEMKKGTRHCNWRVRGKLRAILGEDPAYALMAEMAAELEQSTNEDELRAAASFKTMLATLPEAAQKAENPTSLSTDGVVWRKRRDSNPR